MPKSHSHEGKGPPAAAKPKITYEAMQATLGELARHPELIDRYWQSRFVSHEAREKYQELFTTR